MNNKPKIKIKKNFGFLVLIISGIIGIGFLLGMLSPFYDQPEDWDYNEEFKSDETFNINGSFEDSEGIIHEINFTDNPNPENILFVYKDGRNAEFKTSSEFITDYHEGNIENYLFAVTQVFITVNLDKKKQKIEITDNHIKILDINQEDDIDESTIFFSDWNNVYNNKIDESEGYEQRWATTSSISIDQDNKIISIDEINEINEEFTLASQTDGDYGTIYFESEWK